MDTLVILNLLLGLGLRVSLVATLETRFRGTQPQEVPVNKTGDKRVGLVKYSALPKKAALYTMKTSSEQRLTYPSEAALRLVAKG